MFFRACCLPAACLALVAGCQSPSTALFPWTDDSSVPSLTEAELNRSRQALEVERDSFRDSVQAVNPAASPDSGSVAASDDVGRAARVSTWLLRGQEAIRKSSETGQPDVMLSEATQSFREVLRLDPDNADAWHGLAIVSDLNEDWDVADMSYKRALAKRPDDVNLLNDQGYSYVLQNRYHEAAQYLNRALQISPAHEKAHINLAILDIRRGNSNSAFERLTQIYPADQARTALASLTQEHGVRDENLLPLNHPGPQNSIHGQLAGAPNPQQPAAHAVNSPLTPGTASQPVMTVDRRPPVSSQGNGLPGQPAPAVQSQVTQSRVTHAPLFSQAGVIQPRTAPAEIRPTAATETGTPGPRIAPATLQRTVPAAPAGVAANTATPAGGSSPLDTARRVGGTFQMPASWNGVRPQLPASANVYQPGQPSSAGYQQPQPQPQSMPQQPAAAWGTSPAPSPAAAPPAQQPNGQMTPGSYQQGQQQQPYQLPQYQYPTGTYQPAPTTHGQPAPGTPTQPGFQPSRHPGQPISVLPGQSAASTPIDSMRSADGRPISVLPSEQPVNPHAAVAPAAMSSGTYYGATPAMDPRLTPAQPPMNGGHPGPQAGWQTPNSAAPPYGAASIPPQGAVSVNPAGWSQPPAGTTGQPAAAAPYPTITPGMTGPGVAGSPTPAPPSLGPGYFSPPPVAGNGYRDPAAIAAPDPLSEYRATRDQMNSTYNQTLQKLNDPSGSSFQ